MEEDPFLLADPGDALDVLHGPDLLVGVLYRDQDGIRTDGVFHRRWVDKSLRVDVEHGHTEALLSEGRRSVQHGEILDARGDEVLALLLPERQCDTLEGHVAGLGAPGREDELLGLGTQSAR